MQNHAPSQVAKVGIMTADLDDALAGNKLWNARELRQCCRPTARQSREAPRRPSQQTTNAILSKVGGKPTRSVGRGVIRPQRCGRHRRAELLASYLIVVAACESPEVLRGKALCRPEVPLAADQVPASACMRNSAPALSFWSIACTARGAGLYSA